VVGLDVGRLALRKRLDRRALAAACLNARATGVRRHGKYLLVDFTSERVLVAHLA
jgi:formamidopyrimidine-DNA glycosylase